MPNTMPDNKKLFILVGVLVIIALIIIVAASQGTKKTGNAPAGVSNQTINTPPAVSGGQAGVPADMPETPASNGGNLVSGNSTTTMNNNPASGKKEMPGASVVVNALTIKPSTFTVLSGSQISFTVNSGDTQAHNIVFSDSGVGAGDLSVAGGETKSTIFTAPKPGEYAFHCSISGHEKETGNMTVK